MSLQIFVWVGQGEVQENRIHYHSFTLNDQTYHVGDCVYLYPEDEQYPPYIARILAAFVDRDVQTGADPHCIEVKWFERRVNLEPSTKGIEESEREVFELEDTDINPIGCISGKCRIVKAVNYEEAYNRPGCGLLPGWYFCRGYFQQSSNSFVAYTDAEMAAGEAYSASAQPPRGPGPDGPLAGPQHPPLQPPPGRGPGSAESQPPSGSDGSTRGSRQAPTVKQEVLPSAFANGAGGGLCVSEPAACVAAGSPYDVDEESDEPVPGQRRLAAHLPPAQQQPAGKRQKATGRTCVECGATSTPQWREGPMGPKTLCNACGVRYVRSQQKAAGQKRSGSAPKNGQGRPQELTPPRAQLQTDRGTKRGTNQKAT